MKYIKNMAVALSLGTIAATFATASTVKAQTVNSGQVEMTATVGSYCLFEDELDGTLGVDSGDLATLDSALSGNNIIALDGAAGTIDVTCNDASSTINISTVTETSPAGATVDTYTTTVSGLTSNIVSVDGAPGTAVAVGSINTETLSVNLTATYNDNLMAGDYTFTVNLEATP